MKLDESWSVHQTSLPVCTRTVTGALTEDVIGESPYQWRTEDCNNNGIEDAVAIAAFPTHAAIQ